MEVNDYPIRGSAVRATNSYITTHLRLERRPNTVALLSITLLLLAYIPRIINLGKYDFWWDEIWTVMVGRSATLADVITATGKHLGSTPLDYIFAWATIHIAGESEFVLRYLALMWSVITVALVFLTGNLLRRGMGKWAALFVAISPLAIRYSQEARFYSLGLMLGTAVVAVAILAARSRIRISWIAWCVLVVLASAAIHAFVYAILLCFAGFPIIFFCTAHNRRVRMLSWFGTGLVAAGILFLPWYFFGFNTSPHSLGTSVIGVNEFGWILAGLELTKTNTGFPSSIGTDTYPLIVTVLSILALAYCLLRVRSNGLWICIAALYIASAAFVSINTIRVHYFFHPRQYIFLLTERALLFGAILWWAETRVTQMRITSSVKRLFGAIAVLLVIAPASAYTSMEVNRLESGLSASVARYIANQVDFTKTNAWFLPKWQSLSVNYYIERYSPGKVVNWLKAPGDALGNETYQLLQSADSGSLIVVSDGSSETADNIKKVGFERAWPPVNEPSNFIVYKKDMQP
jgi:uncharacterized membrane protein